METYLLQFHDYKRSVLIEHENRSRELTELADADTLNVSYAAFLMPLSPISGDRRLPESPMAKKEALTTACTFRMGLPGARYPSQQPQP
jgi:hypothetical protein